MYRWYQIMICLLKFDFFCFSGVTIQVLCFEICLVLACLPLFQLLIIVLPRDSAEFAVTIAAIPVVLFLLAACGLAVAHEIKWRVFHVFFSRIDPDFMHRLMTASLMTMLAAMSYCTYLADI